MSQLTPPRFPLEAHGSVPLSCELDDETALHPAEPRDLDLARHLARHHGGDELREDPQHIYHFLGLCFYRTDVLMPPTPRIGRAKEPEARPMWVRSGTVCHSGYPFEPDEYDEALVDDTEVFASLANAICQTIVDELARKLWQIDNACPSCMGLGGSEEIDGGRHACKPCGNTGWIPMKDPAAA